MSIAPSPIDLRTSLSHWLAGLVDMYTKDIRATPEDKWDAPMGGATRPASVLTADAVSLMEWTTAALQGKEGDHQAAYARLKEECKTKGGAEAALKKAADEFSAALKAASDERLASEVMAPWQMPTPVVILAHIAVSHLWYHDGQVNFIQALLGDGEVHWME